MEQIRVIAAFSALFVGYTYWIFTLGIKHEKNKAGASLKPEDVVKCFKDVDWNTQSFIYNSTEITSSDGTKHFLKAQPVKDAIEKLNKLINKEQ